MAQVIQIDPAVFEAAPSLASVGEPVTLAPIPVAESQPMAASMPAWYMTPIAAVPVAAAAFILGNVLMMIPWSTL